MSDIIENKMWINAETCLTMAESIESFVDIYGEYVYDKKGSDNTIIILGLGRIHLPSTESYPLYFKSTEICGHKQLFRNFFLPFHSNYLENKKQ